MLPPGLESLLHRLMAIPNSQRTTWQAQAIGELEALGLMLGRPGTASPTMEEEPTGTGVGGRGWHEPHTAAMTGKGTGTGFDPEDVDLPSWE